MTDDNTSAIFKDVSGQTPRTQDQWSPLVIRKAAIDAEIARLLDISPPVNGKRSTKIIHPSATAPGYGFAPGTDVTINVLKPGERTWKCRTNANHIEVTLSGEGTLIVDGDARRVSKWGVFTIPSMSVFEYHNTSDTPWVRLTYSNAPVLEMLEACYREEFEGDTPPADKGKTAPNTPSATGPRARDLALNTTISSDGAQIRGYEWLIDLEPTESRPLYWPYEEVAKHLPSAEQLSSAYNGRRVFLLYNPATGDKMGTSQSFFATISSSPINNNYIPHRHTSSAINYYLRGKGFSKVGGDKIEWEAGDLLLSAPSWIAHSHHSQADSTSALTIQDHPFHIGLHSLVWQERMNEKILTLGAQGGLETNRAQLIGVGS